MKKFFLLCSGLSVVGINGDNDATNLQDQVILRNAEVIAKQVADAINIDLLYLQYYHDTVYDALCLSLIMEPNNIVTTQNISLLESLHLIDEHHRIHEDVQKVLAARLLDRNSRNPSPYQLSMDSLEDALELENIDTGFELDR